MSANDDQEFNLDGWGNDKTLVEGTCGHCHHSVAFKRPKQTQSFCISERIPLADGTVKLDHFIVAGICPRPSCRKATIIYRLEKSMDSDDPADRYSQPDLAEQHIIFPKTSLRSPLAQEIPESLRTQYVEAASIEYLSPNGSAFLAGRILEQALRHHLNKTRKKRAKLAPLIDEFLRKAEASGDLHALMTDIREFRNIAGHATQDEAGDWASVDQIEASYTLDVLAELLEYIYVRPQRQKCMRERWQNKKKGHSIPQSTGPAFVVGGSKQQSSETVLSHDDLPF